MTSPHTHYRALVADLRVWAKGDLRIEAAVNLLAGHGVWLRRADFLDRCVALTSPEIRDLVDVRAWVDFDEAGRIAEGGPASLPASTSELQILALAASLADARVDRSLHDLVTGLDDRNLALVLDAVAHTAAWHEKGHSYLVTGRPVQVDT